MDAENLVKICGSLSCVPLQYWWCSLLFIGVLVGCSGTGLRVGLCYEAVITDYKGQTSIRQFQVIRMKPKYPVVVDLATGKRDTLFGGLKEEYFEIACPCKN